MGFSSQPPKNKKEIELYGKAPNKQKKKKKHFLGFLLIITTTSMESKLAKSYN